VVFTDTDFEPVHSYRALVERAEDHVREPGADMLALGGGRGVQDGVEFQVRLDSGDKFEAEHLGPAAMVPGDIERYVGSALERGEVSQLQTIWVLGERERTLSVVLQTVEAGPELVLLDFCLDKCGDGPQPDWAKDVVKSCVEARGR